MTAQLKVIRDDKAKGKSSVKAQEATEELNYLMNFNQSITFVIAKTMQDLSDFVFINMVNITLARHESYLDYLKSEIKHDTLAYLRTAPLHLGSLFLDSIIQKPEGVKSYDDKHYSHLTSSHRKPAQHSPTVNLQGLHRIPAGNPHHQPGKCSSLGQNRQGWGKASTHNDQPRVFINDNYCVTQRGFVERDGRTKSLVNSLVNCHTLIVNFIAPNHVPFVDMQPQKRGIRPIITAIKHVKGVSCEEQLSSVQPVTNVHTVAQNVSVGARLNQFLKTWATLGASHKVIRIL